MVMWVSDDPRKPFGVFLAVTVALWLNDNSTVAIYKMSSCCFFFSDAHWTMYGESDKGARICFRIIQQQEWQKDINGAHVAKP